MQILWRCRCSRVVDLKLPNNWVRTLGKKSGANRKILVVYTDNNLPQVRQKWAKDQVWKVARRALRKTATRLFCKAGACFSKVPKLFGRISGDIILFVS